jgi:hypothetical protein
MRGMIRERRAVYDSCETELALEQQCDHDPRTVHNWCLDCYENNEGPSSIEWNDLD